METSKLVTRNAQNFYSSRRYRLFGVPGKSLRFIPDLGEKLSLSFRG